MPDPCRFLLDEPLYRAFEIGPEDTRHLIGLRFYRGAIDVHCFECGRDTVFLSTCPALRVSELPSRREFQEVGVSDLLSGELKVLLPYDPEGGSSTGTYYNLSELAPIMRADRMFKVTFACTRVKTHQLYFFFRIQNGKISKIGQSPSFADLQAEGVAKYRAVLGNDRYRELTKAIGLNAHGVGVGAFVYLRRIFESLVQAAHQQAAADPSWDEAAFSQSRMEEKVRLLKGWLPEHLVQNRQVYAILSRGIHELTEAECLGLFEPVRVGIELILDEEIERRERTAKVAASTAALAKVNATLGGRGPPR